MRKFAVISTNEDPTYLFFAPITALIWRELIGYEPFVHLVPKDIVTQSSLYHFVSESLIDQLIHSNTVAQPGECESGVISSACRIYSCTLPFFRDEDYILISDIDMWPLDPVWFNLQDWKKPMHFWGADSYPFEQWRMMPSCYNGASKAIWRQFLGLDNKISMGNAISRDIVHFTRCFNAKFGRFWGYEEMLLAELLLKVPNYREAFQFIDREPGRFFHPDRLHRDHWTWQLLASSKDECIVALRDKLRPYDGSATGFKDAHLLRPGYTEANWPDLRELLSQLIKPSSLAWVDSYVKDFRDVLASPTTTTCCSGK